MRKALVVLLLGALASTAGASEIVFNNFSDVYTYLGVNYFDHPGESYNVTTGSPVGRSSTFEYTMGMAFTPSARGPLESIDLALSYFSSTGPGSGVIASLYQSDALGKPGTLLETFPLAQAGGALPSGGSPPTIWHPLTTLTSVVQPWLDDSTEYILMLDCPGPEPTADRYTWNFNNLTPLNQGFRVFRRSTDPAGTWTRQASSLSAFRVTVPEPASLALLGLASLVMLRRHRD